MLHMYYQGVLHVLYICEFLLVDTSSIKKNLTAIDLHLA